MEREIMKELRKDQKVTNTCVTGIAATHYGDLGANGQLEG
jgi:hypothetical protein